jgi:2-hydroxycyclohexanecarboxyl-CoA dehydrogenase
MNRSTEGEPRRVAMVTGGASGMGQAMCRRLARHGHRIAVLDIDAAGAQRVAEDLRTAGARALGVGADVTDQAAIADAFAKVRHELGPVEILVTSAGHVAFEPFADITLASWHRVVDVNLTGTFVCCQAALPDMIAARWGRIVTISSSSANRGSPRMAHYASSKAAVITLTKTLAREYGRFGITVNNVQPSGIETPMLQRSQEADGLPTNEELVRTIPVGRLGTGDDIAAAALFLASDDASFITGHVLAVNGGSLV